MPAATGSTKVQVSLSPVVQARVVAQAAEMGISRGQYATMLIAQASLQVEQARLAMPEAMRAAGAAAGSALAGSADE